MCLLSTKRKFPRYTCIYNSLSRPKKNLEKTNRQPFGRGLYVFLVGGGGIPRPKRCLGLTLSEASWTVVTVPTGDFDTADTVRASEVDRPPRMNFGVEVCRTRLTPIITVNGQTCQRDEGRADLNGTLLLCKVA